MVREALLRERYRGGQAFYVCPRIDDLGEAKAFLDKHVPELKVVGRPRPDGAGGDRGHHVGVPRRQVRHPAVDHDHRVRARYSDRQHADRASRRHVRPGAALSAARPRRPLEAARLCAVHAACDPQDHAAGRAAAESAAVAGKPRRRLPARLARSRHPRRRQPARRGAVGPHQGSRLRALSVDAGGGDRRR